MTFTPGRLTLTLERAQGLKSRELFGKNDVYAIVRVGKDRVKSCVHKNAGSNVTFQQAFSFMITDQTSAEVELWDEDFFKDDRLGRVTVDLSKLRSCNNQRLELPVLGKHLKRQHGTLFLSLHFEPSASQLNGSAPVPSQIAAKPLSPEDVTRLPQAYDQHNASQGGQNYTGFLPLAPSTPRPQSKYPGGHTSPHHHHHGHHQHHGQQPANPGTSPFSPYEPAYPVHHSQQYPTVPSMSHGSPYGQQYPDVPYGSPHTPTMSGMPPPIRFQ